jgi:hypothetical protein
MMGRIKGSLHNHIYSDLPPLRIREMRNKIRKTKKSIFAIHAAVPATAQNPRTPAINATTKNTRA